MPQKNYTLHYVDVSHPTAGRNENLIHEINCQKHVRVQTYYVFICGHRRFQQKEEMCRVVKERERMAGRKGGMRLRETRHDRLLNKHSSFPFYLITLMMLVLSLNHIYRHKRDKNVMCCLYVKQFFLL